jgi:hypothetical protein
MVRIAALISALAASALLVLATFAPGLAQLAPSPVVVVGSSDVMPMMSAAAVGFRQRSQGAHVSVRPGGGDGTAVFCQGRAHILALPRVLSPAEAGRCRLGRVAYADPVRIDLAMSADAGGAELSRTVFLYVNNRVRRQSAVQDFVGHFIRNSRRLALQTGYLPTEAGEGERAPGPPPAGAEPAQRLQGALSVEPVRIPPGKQATLRWSGENALRAEIDNGVGAVAPRGGSRAVRPSATTTYTLTLVGADGQSLRRQAVVTIDAPPAPQGSLVASPDRIAPGARAKLSWSGTNAAGASIDNGVGAAVLPSGSREVSPSATTAYTLTLVGADGKTVRYRTIVQVDGAAPLQNAGTPEGALRIEPAAIAPGGSATLVWAIANAASASIDNGVGAVAPRNGSIEVRPRETTTYTLTLVGRDGIQIVRQQASIWVRPAPRGVSPFLLAGLAAALLAIGIGYWVLRRRAEPSTPLFRTSRRVPFRNQVRAPVEPELRPSPPTAPEPAMQASARLLADPGPTISVEASPGRGIEINYALLGEPARISIETEAAEKDGSP